MQYRNGQYLYSPSDLIAFMESPFGSAMDRRLLHDSSLKEKIDPRDQLLEFLTNKGHAHEENYVLKLKDQGRKVVEISGDDATKAQATIAAMESGQDIITQGYLTDGEFAGLADFIVRVPGTSRLGVWHYEAWDSKLSRSLKPYFIVQLCCYSQLLEGIQGRLPDEIVVVTGDSEQHRLRLLDYYAYYKSLRAAFVEAHGAPLDELPDPALSSEYGRWENLAKSILEERDHLSRVANIRRNQIAKLEAAGIQTMAQLAATDLARIARMDDGIFARLREQAQLQVRSIGQERPAYRVLNRLNGSRSELAADNSAESIQLNDGDSAQQKGQARLQLGSVRPDRSANRVLDPPVNRPLGLEALPPKSRGDIFFDIEGLPTVEGGLEYLWGATFYEVSGERAYRDFWGHDSTTERDAFRDFVDWALDRWMKFPDMHIYHYGAYEISALRKLMGRHGLREREIDTLLRKNVFVDLFAIVRHGLRLGEPRYSIKNVERLYRPVRTTDVASGSESIVVYEAWRENPDGDDWQSSEVLRSIRDYNIDDCDSTEELVNWLRSQQLARGIAYRPFSNGDTTDTTVSPDPNADLKQRLINAINAAEDEAFVPVLQLFYDCIDFHHRESKPTWWRYFERLVMTGDELYDDPDCLVGVTRIERVPFHEPNAQSPPFEYQFDIDQTFRGRPKRFHVLEHAGLKITTHNYDPQNGLLQFRPAKDLPEIMTLIPDEYVHPASIPDAMISVIKSVLDAPDEPKAITDLLKRESPRFLSSQPQHLPVESNDVLAGTKVAARALDDSYLCIQGPPGAGKSYTAKYVIHDLLAAGKTIGIASNSHKAINHLLSAVASESSDRTAETTFIKVQSNADDPIFKGVGVQHINTASSLTIPRGACIGGTAWTFAHNNCCDQFDYLFIDEAGQVSLANLIAMSRSAKNLILMGDQMQLAQPIQGDHPGDSGLSVLDYLLQEQPVIDPLKGVFLPKTYRMHPELCRVVSEQVYEGKLRSAASCRDHILTDIHGGITKPAGVQFVAVEHVNNQQSSSEEVEAISLLLDDLLQTKFGQSNPRKLSLDGVLIVAPYNAQVNLLRQKLPVGARVGSVDLFQGQEAPVVIVSMCASSAADVPRGLDFLFSQNRLNVAISRAQALALVVANPALANTAVKRLDQMKLVNFFCRLLE